MWFVLLHLDVVVRGDSVQRVLMSQPPVFRPQFLASFLAACSTNMSNLTLWPHVQPCRFSALKVFEDTLYPEISDYMFILKLSETVIATQNLF